MRRRGASLNKGTGGQIFFFECFAVGTGAETLDLIHHGCFRDTVVGCLPFVSDMANEGQWLVLLVMELMCLQIFCSLPQLFREVLHDGEITRTKAAPNLNRWVRKVRRMVTRRGSGGGGGCGMPRASDVRCVCVCVL